MPDHPPESSDGTPCLHDRWSEDSASWLQSEVVKLNYITTGLVEDVFTSATSHVSRVPTTHGYLYLKECAPLFAYEPALTQAISTCVPVHSPHVLLIDEQRCYLLMEDVGTTLKASTQTHRDLALWTRAVATFARFQIATIPHTALLQAHGCPDRTLSTLPTLFDTLLTDAQSLLVDKPGGISTAELAQLYAFKPQLLALCQQLASYGIPETLHHDDLTAGNIALDDRRVLFFDWTESAITHPFCSMFVLLRVARHIFHFDDGSLAHLRDAYLEPWTDDYQPLTALRDAFALSQRLAMLSRALTWHYIVTHLPEQERAESLDASAYWLLLFLHNGVEPEHNP
jgi:aminoglycoside phosphotransferase (APT) family kinase protein